MEWDPPTKAELDGLRAEQAELFDYLIQEVSAKFCDIRELDRIYNLPSD